QRSHPRLEVGAHLPVELLGRGRGGVEGRRGGRGGGGDGGELGIDRGDDGGHAAASSADGEGGPVPTAGRPGLFRPERRPRSLAWSYGGSVESSRARVIEADARLGLALEVLTGRRIAVLTGAGISTDSGIPDYRGPGSPPRTPMTFQQFVGDSAFRRHYWARNHVGWRHVGATRPNAGHRALARLEGDGVVSGIITQNVDLLHQAAGSRNVIDLHGRYDRVVCLDCGNVISRAALAERLENLNPGFVEQVGAVGDIEIAPDADAVIEQTAHFVVADCAL